MDISISEYLSPTNPLASTLVGFLRLLFVIWLAGLICYAIHLIKRRREISSVQDVQELAAAILHRDSEKEDKEQGEEADAIFRKFCLSKSLPETSQVTKHFKAIFLAGWMESRLEASDLIEHTTSDLLRFNRFLRSVLATFIVLGLLGTLFGLADSLKELAPALQGSTDATAVENTERMTGALRSLLSSMKGALAPSILGICFTVFGVFLYGLHIQVVCHPVKSTLEQLTLTIWIPQLYPTTSLKLVQTLHESEKQMRRGYDTATRVGELVETVQDNISEFNQNLSRANAITQPLSTSASQINVAANSLNESFAQSLTDFSQSFAENVTRLTGFQGEIHNLYQQLIDESMVFQTGANRRLDQQNQNLDAMLMALKSYEEAYVASRQQLDETLRQYIIQAEEANTGLNATNRQLLENIRDQLKTNLESLQQVLVDQLGAVVDRFNRFDVPLKKAADRIETIVESFAKIAEGTIGELQIKFQTQNENNKKQLNAITDLNEKIVALLNQLDQNSVNQSTAINILSGNVEGLTAHVEPLADSIQSLTSDSGVFSRSIVAIEGHVESLTTTSRNMIEKADETTQSLASGALALSESIDSIGEHVESLGRNSQQLTERADATAQSLTSDSGALGEAIRGIAGQVDILVTSFRQLVERADAAAQSLTLDSDALSKSIDVIEQHVQSLSNTSVAIEGHLETFGVNSRQLAEQADIATQSLIVNSETLSISMGSIEGHVQSLGNTSRQLIEKADVTALTADIRALRNAINEIVQHTKTLAEYAQTAATYMAKTDSERNTPERASSLWPFRKK